MHFAYLLQIPRRSFLGSSSQLPDLTAQNSDEDKSGKVLSKFGLRTVSSGQLHLRLNIVQQRNRPPTGLPPRVNASAHGSRATELRQTTSAVLAAFQRANKRLSQRHAPHGSESVA